MEKNTKNADKFVQKMSQDIQLRKKVANLYKQNAHREIERLATDSGFPCTYKELVEAFKSHGLQGQELSDRDLKFLAAGASKKGGEGPDAV